MGEQALGLGQASPTVSRMTARPVAVDALDLDELAERLDRQSAPEARARPPVGRTWLAPVA